MALPANYRTLASQPPPTVNHPLTPGTPINVGILKERLRAQIGASPATSSSSSTNSSPFVPSPHGHPSFNPVKVGTKASAISSDTRVPKPPKPPDKPLMPYMRYSRKVWDQVKAQNPDLKLWEIGKIIGQMWRELSDDDKQEYIDDYEAEKLEYNEALKSYNSSPAFQAWVAAKAKAQQAAEEREVLERTSTVGNTTKSDGRVSIQPAEDEDDQDDGFSVKHVASARYLRNHRLINEVFSDSVVPDVRSVVTTARMSVLKRQVQSLTMHQKKLEAELQQIEEKFEAKKRKFLESSESFNEELKKQCSKGIDSEMYQKMVEKATEQIKKERAQALAAKEEADLRRCEEEEDRKLKEAQKQEKDDNEMETTVGGKDSKEDADDKTTDDQRSPSDSTQAEEELPGREKINGILGRETTDECRNLSKEEQKSNPETTGGPTSKGEPMDVDIPKSEEREDKEVPSQALLSDSGSESISSGKPLPDNDDSSQSRGTETSD